MDCVYVLTYHEGGELREVCGVFADQACAELAAANGEHEAPYFRTRGGAVWEAVAHGSGGVDGWCRITLTAVRETSELADLLLSERYGDLRGVLDGCGQVDPR